MASTYRCPASESWPFCPRSKASVAARSALGWSIRRERCPRSTSNRVLRRRVRPGTQGLAQHLLEHLGGALPFVLSVFTNREELEPLGKRIPQGHPFRPLEQ